MCFSFRIDQRQPTTQGEVAVLPLPPEGQDAFHLICRAKTDLEEMRYMQGSGYGQGPVIVLHYNFALTLK